MRLEEYLRRQGESQAAFAKRAGVAQQTVSMICTGGGSRTATALRIVEATGGLVSFAELAGEEYGQRAS